MYGLESILGNLLTTAASPAIGGLAGDFISKEVVDNTMPELLKDITGVTAGALGGAALGAGLGAATGGKQGALGGAVSGGLGGGLGGYKSEEVLKSLGLGQDALPMQGDNASVIREDLYTGSSFDPQKTLVPPSDGVGPSAPGKAYMGLGSDTMKNIQDLGGAPSPGPVNKTMASVQNPLEAAGAPSNPTEQKNYIDFLKGNYELLAPMFFGGQMLTTTGQYNEDEDERKKALAYADYQNERRGLGFARSLMGYADGGGLTVRPNANTSVHFPEWFVNDYQRSGGLAALQPSMKEGMANGGYINTSPMPEDAYPQSQIARAQPYPAATPQRHEVVDFERGGLLEGEGDGMSDDIPANISGKEPIKVADGEYAVPLADAKRYGPEKLENMMDAVRAAAHAKKGKQIVENAAKRAFIKTLTGVHA